MPSRPMTEPSPYYVGQNANFTPLDQWTQKSYNTNHNHTADRKDLLRTLHSYDNAFF